MQNALYRILLHTRSQRIHRYRSSWIQWQGGYVVYVLELVVPQSRPWHGSYENYIIGPSSSGRISSSTIRPEHVRVSWKIISACILSGATSCIRNLWGRVDVLRISFNQGSGGRQQKGSLTAKRLRIPAVMCTHHLVRAVFKASSRCPLGFSHATNAST